MNVVTYWFYYYFPTRQLLSMFIATPLAATLSPVIITYTVGTSYLIPPIINTTSYFLVKPLSDLTYKGWEWVIYQPSMIELMPMNRREYES